MPQQGKDVYTVVGEPTEAALKVLVEKIGHSFSRANGLANGTAKEAGAMSANDYHAMQLSRVLTFEFTRDRKLMSVLVRRDALSSGHLFVKGAPESVLDRCTSVQVGGKVVPMTPALYSSVLDSTLRFGKSGLRTLALAYRDVSSTEPSEYSCSSSSDYSCFEQDLTFVSLVGMLDPPRPEVKEAVANCRAAGIRVICVTGDNKGTAETICRQIGIFSEDEDLTGKSYTGREFDALTQEEKIQVVQRASLFTRTEPNHKSQLVDLLQGLGLVVAMTGGASFRKNFFLVEIHNALVDGVNDAPALKKADIGVAMGSGTDVAKLAADMVLADSNFATIELAVEEGRLIYNNTKQFIRYLSTYCDKRNPSPPHLRLFLSCLSLIEHW